MIALGSDHAGLPLKKEIMELLDSMGVAYKDFGTYTEGSCDYAIVVNATNREAIKQGIEESGMDAGKVFYADSLNQAHVHLAQILRAGDVVLYENDLPDNFK